MNERILELGLEKVASIRNEEGNYRDNLVKAERRDSARRGGTITGTTMGILGAQKGYEAAGPTGALAAGAIDGAAFGGLGAGLSNVSSRLSNRIARSDADNRVVNYLRNNYEKKLQKFASPTPRLMRGAIGAGLGIGAGHLYDRKQDTGTRRGKIIGGLAGAGLGVGAGHLNDKRRTKANQKEIKGWVEQTEKPEFRKGTDDIFNKYTMENDAAKNTMDHAYNKSKMK